MKLPQRLSRTLNPTYDPKIVETEWMDIWREEKIFEPSETTKPVFSIVLPPPNVTGKLHIGHTLTCAIQDCIVRWKRMSGFRTLWLPGVDHAGIATQTVVEKDLIKKEGKTRHDLGRNEFLNRVWKWKQSNHNSIMDQMEKLAASTDRSRECFTLDDRLSEAVKEAFCRFHAKGLIHRSERLVNWCPYLRTALSDIEVDHFELTSRTELKIPGYEGKVEVGVMTYFRYKFVGSEEYVEVGTTRLETMLGDSGVAAHPNDLRYQHFKNRSLEHPFFARKLKFVFDESVDPDLGTGCVKITPSHDFNDFQRGKRHSLEFINILDEDGRINADGGEFAGLHRYDARVEVEKRLKELNLFSKKDMKYATKENPMKLGVCSRSGDVIEPLSKPQWFFDCQDLAKKSKEAVEKGDLKILPEIYRQTWFRWLDQVQDWCISRQLWWGHRIPAYFSESCNSWFVARSEEEAKMEAEKDQNFKNDLKQDEDVLDTWFSSGLFPFSTLGWPHKTKDLETFFPNSLLETGHDIIFFWVARMVMCSIGLFDKVPFREVYLHAMIRDSQGKKMSKSSGNVIDPLEVIHGCDLETLLQKLEEGNLAENELKRSREMKRLEFPQGIPECGSDALRFGLLAYTCQGREIHLNISKVVAYRHFCNKVWQATNFVLNTKSTSLQFSEAKKFEDLWILERLQLTVNRTIEALETYSFADATQALYAFFRDDFCDVYIELSKKRDSTLLREILKVSLKLLHPFLPFLTEELFHRLEEGNYLANTEYPKKIICKEEKTEEMQKNLQIVSGLRFLKSSTKTLLRAHVRGEYRIEIVEILARVEICEFETLREPASYVVNDTTVFLERPQNTDETKKRLKKELEFCKKRVEQIEKKISAPEYETRVPSKIKLENIEKLKNDKKKIEEIEKLI